MSSLLLPAPSAPILVKASEAGRLLGVERRTLIRWARAGRLPYVRHGPLGHWRFERSAVLALCRPGGVTETSTRIDAIYARVSTRKQLPYLDAQVAGLVAKYPDCVVFRDCASGLNFRRKGLEALLQLVLARRVRIVHLAYRDRLCRFAYDLLERLFAQHGTELAVEAHADAAPESELADDLLAIITVFGARFYGRRSRCAQGRQGQRGQSARGRREGADDQKTPPLSAHDAAGRTPSQLQDSDVSDRGTASGAGARL